MYIRHRITVVQRQKAVSAYSTSKQILLFGFAEQWLMYCHAHLWHISHHKTLPIGNKYICIYRIKNALIFNGKHWCSVGLSSEVLAQSSLSWRVITYRSHRGPSYCLRYYCLWALCGIIMVIYVSYVNDYVGQLSIIRRPIGQIYYVVGVM